MAEPDPNLDIEYKLTYEMANLDQVTQVENKYGKSVWYRLTPDDLEKFTWEVKRQVSRDLADLADQRAKLELDGTTLKQPVRNVQLFRRIPKGEWEPV